VTPPRGGESPEGEGAENAQANPTLLHPTVISYWDRHTHFPRAWNAFYARLEAVWC
jgi:hypothetical protein